MREDARRHLSLQTGAFTARIAFISVRRETRSSSQNLKMSIQQFASDTKILRALPRNEKGTKMVKWQVEPLTHHRHSHTKSKCAQQEFVIALTDLNTFPAQAHVKLSWPPESQNVACWLGAQDQRRASESRSVPCNHQIYSSFPGRKP